jgi:hypothetical protein
MRLRTGTSTVAALTLAAAGLLACGSDPKPDTHVIVVPQGQAAQPTTIVQHPGTIVPPPGARLVGADGRNPPRGGRPAQNLRLTLASARPEHMFEPAHSRLLMSVS